MQRREWLLPVGSKANLKQGAGNIIRMSESKTAHYAGRLRVTFAAVSLGLIVAAGPTQSSAQAPGAVYSTNPLDSERPTGASTASQSSVTAGAQQQLYNATGSNGAQATPDSFKGSVVDGKSTGTTIDLSLDEAIRRGLRQNLGLILQSSAQKNANGQRLEQLQDLLPTVTGRVSYSVQQINLAAFGLSIPGLNPIIGPFQVVDFRALMTQKLLDISSLQNYLAAKHNFQSANFTAEDATNMVVLTVGNAYLLCIADQARIESVNAELATSKVTLDQAIAAHDAGTSPKLDVLRAQVDYQNVQQSLISTKNSLAKDKLALARTIGLPLDQEFRLTDQVPYAALDQVNPETAFAAALKSRKDLQAAEEQVKVAQAEKKAAFASQLPVAKANGDFGDLGNTPGHSHGTYLANGEISAPISADREDAWAGDLGRCAVPDGDGEAVGPDPAGERGYSRQHPGYTGGGEAGGGDALEC